MSEFNKFEEYKLFVEDTIKTAVANFKTDLREKIKNTDDKSLGNNFKKIIDKLKENGKKLFSDPMTVYVNDEK
jgi:hypothetical protein